MRSKFFFFFLAFGFVAQRRGGEGIQVQSVIVMAFGGPAKLE
jgi:hypothetical protein